MHLKSPKSYQLANSVLLASLLLNSACSQFEIKPEVSLAEKSVELVYQTTFHNYQGYSASIIQPWKQTNDTVKDTGGWPTYAKEITEDQSAKPSTSVHSHGAHQ